jgi:hypothetical protein
MKNSFLEKFLEFKKVSADAENCRCDETCSYFSYKNNEFKCSVADNPVRCKFIESNLNTSIKKDYMVVEHIIYHIDELEKENHRLEKLVEFDNFKEITFSKVLNS